MFAFIPKEMVQKEKRNKSIILKNMNAENLSEEEIMLLPLIKCLERNSRGGLTGLQNLGNTCFMSSVI